MIKVRVIRSLTFLWVPLVPAVLDCLVRIMSPAKPVRNSDEVSTSALRKWPIPSPFYPQTRLSLASRRRWGGSLTFAWSPSWLRHRLWGLVPSLRLLAGESAAWGRRRLLTWGARLGLIFVLILVLPWKYIDTLRYALYYKKRAESSLMPLLQESESNKKGI